MGGVRKMQVEEEVFKKKIKPGPSPPGGSIDMYFVLQHINKFTNQMTSEKLSRSLNSK